jgi:hypothetical protein
LGLVLVAMLNLVFQSCALAIDMDAAQPCPHCPVEVSQVQHPQLTHLDEIYDCDYADVYSSDSRAAQSKAKDSMQDLPCIIDRAYFTGVAAARQSACVRASPSGKISAGAPLYVLYCVYLN